MARRESILRYEQPGSRDHGKTYVLKEPDALTAEWWATRALLLLAQEGVDIGETTGVAGLAAAGMSALGKIKSADLKPLLDEMLTWIFIAPDPAQPTNVRQLNAVMGDVEEIGTLLQLRMAMFELLTGFSMPALPSTSTSATRAPDASSIIQTSRAS